ncbi:MAG TPA: GDP-mannose 4,6-dehydratase [Anaeromyxobacter sp.]
MKALIFGASGQDGHYLGALCRAEGIEPVGISRVSAPVRGDVAHRAEVEELVRAHRPAYVFQLAASSTTRHEALFENHETISTGALNVLEAVRLHAPEARVFIAGSGVQFENTGAPISERAPFAATSPYAVARIQSVYAARYFRSLGVRAYVGYLFHHESPLRKPEHVAMKVALAARRIVAGSAERLEIGDLSVAKEWTFAGDIARAIFTLVRQDAAVEAAIGSGEAHPIQEWIERCFAVAGKDWRDHVDVRAGFVPEYRRLVSDPATIRSLGWAPTVGFEDLARRMVNGG